MREEIRLLRRGQRFSVNVYEPTHRQLADRGALIQVGETGALALRKEFYDDERAPASIRGRWIFWDTDGR
jgi:hypothetical protein